MRVGPVCARVGPAYAKVNLALEVLARRADGYHDLRTVFLTIDWHDLVTVAIAPLDAGGEEGAGAPAPPPEPSRSSPPGPPLRVVVEGPSAEPSMAQPDALVARAAEALRLAAPVLAGSGLAVEVAVHKRVPVAAGLGGGSADAAAVLRLGVLELARHGLRLEAGALHDLASGLGSDVPFALIGGAALGEGRGERLRTLPRPELHLAVAVAAASSTVSAYAALRSGELGGHGRAERVAAAVRRGRPPDDADLGSALESAACRAAPGLGEALGRLRDATPGQSWHLTGSGGAAFALAEDARTARRLAAAAARTGLPARACRAVGPLHFGP